MLDTLETCETVTESTATIGTATYSPEDNKIRITPFARLDAATYARVKAAGFAWAPRQGIFVAPMWTPGRADLAVELCGELGDEDTSLVDRAEERAERFEGYKENRTRDAERAHAAVSAIADNIPLGQPILVGHHSERHARKDAERIENGMRKAVKMWETAQYWQARAAGAIRHAKYKERPDVRARRIKTIEADKRKQVRYVENATRLIELWGTLHAPAKDADGFYGAEPTPQIVRARAIAIANQDRGYWSDRHQHPSGYVGPISLWEAAGGNIYDKDPEEVAIATPDEIRDRAIRGHEGTIAWAQRWIAHYDLRLTYERAMLGESGGTEADRTKPEKGGAVRCWASPRGGWSYVVKVNKVSITVLDNWGNGGDHFTRTIELDKLAGVMSAADVITAKREGRLVECAPDSKGKIQGFALRDGALASPKPATEDRVCPDGAACPDAACIAERERQGLPVADGLGDDIAAMRQSLKAGVKAVSVPTLFATPKELAQRVADLADIRPGHRVLEPSAGTGMLLGACGGRMFGAFERTGSVHAVEINGAMVDKLRAEYPLTTVIHDDFLDLTVGELGGLFDRILMNPPFDNGADIKHIRHARTMLAPGGVLVAICANGPRQQAAFRDEAESWEDLPAGTFAGTNVRAALIVLRARE